MCARTRADSSSSSSSSLVPKMAAVRRRRFLARQLLHLRPSIILNPRTITISSTRRCIVFRTKLALKNRAAYTAYKQKKHGWRRARRRRGSVGHVSLPARRSCAAGCCCRRPTRTACVCSTAARARIAFTASTGFIPSFPLFLSILRMLSPSRVYGIGIRVAMLRERTVLAARRGARRRLGTPTRGAEEKCRQQQPAAALADGERREEFSGKIRREIRGLKLRA